MSGPWSFLKNQRNREVLGWLGGGVVAVIGALWAVFVYFDRSDPDPVVSDVEASGSSIATGGNIEGSTINIQSTAPAPPAQPQENADGQPAN